MIFEWPEFSDPIPIDRVRRWTATFDSFDERNENSYYVICLYEALRLSSRFMAQVGLWWAGEDWRLPEFTDRLRSELHAIALTGRSNTSYTGPLSSTSRAVVL